MREQQLVSSLWHLAGVMQMALKHGWGNANPGSAEMLITSEDARDVKAASAELRRLHEVVRLQRLAIEAHKQAPPVPQQDTK